IAEALSAGMELVVNDPPPGTTPLDWILETGASYVMGVPTHAMDILGEMRRRGLDKLGEVKTFYMAGAPIPREVAQSFLDRGVIPQNVYGMSENSSHQYTLPSDAPETIVATCGKACRAYEIRLFDQENPDIEVMPGEIGEIGGRGACLMLGYFDNQQATEDSFNRGGWFLSGDLGRFDADGNLEIVGRKKDLIIRGGHNIHPAKIEDLTMRHPAVARCAAFAVADERLGEKVCLSVIFHEGANASADELLRHLHETGLSRFDMPEYFIAMSAYPLTASGKILKRELLVTGAGDRAFSAGADIKELMGRSLVEQRAGALLGQAVLAKLDQLSMPSVALINGYAFGGGLELALACTFRLAVPSAKLGF